MILQFHLGEEIWIKRRAGKSIAERDGVDAKVNFKFKSFHMAISAVKIKLCIIR